MLNTHGRTAYDSEFEMFRDSVRRFYVQEMLPNLTRWAAQGKVDRSFWKAAGDAGLLCPTVPETYGGLGLDYRYNAIIGEERAYLDAWMGITLQSDIVAEYLVAYGSEEQKRRYLPAMVSGDYITAIGMTEPNAGSDLQGIRTTAVRDGEEYVINGSKTYITNGQHADMVIVVAKTDPTKGAKGTSLILVDADTPGFRRGRNLDKIGQDIADTSELFFDDLRVPVSACLGKENSGFVYLMNNLPQERLSIAIEAQALAQRALDEALRYARDRKAFGRAIIEFQNSRFKLAQAATELQVGWAHLDWAITRHVAGELTAAEASAAKLWHTETMWRIVDMALQMHGGAGYMNDYPIAGIWKNARVLRIYGGTSEIMAEVIGRAL